MKWALAALLAGCAPSPPADWRDEVIYQIVTDRFANGDPSNDDASGVPPMPGVPNRIHGGDFRGITEHLDYVAALGATAIWISPIVRNVARNEVGDGYHGYWASDFTELEPRFGDEAALRQLVGAAHARGMRVIVDVVPNHAGRVFDYDVDGDGVPDPDPAISPTYTPEVQPGEVIFSARPQLFTAEGTLTLRPEHFRRRGIGDLGVPEERRYGDFPEGLRDLDTDRDEVIEALIATFARWAIDFELDGYRIDAVPHVDRAFWPRFCTGLRERLAAAGRTQFFLFGEVFETRPESLVPWLVPGGIDAAFDIPLKFGLIDGVILGGGAPAGAAYLLEDARRIYPMDPAPLGVGLDPWQARIVFGDSHDVTRLRALVDDPFAVDQALVAVFTAGGIPLVYYGTEQEFAGGGGHLGREPLWETDYPEDGATFRLIQLLAAIRRGSPALRRGDTTVRWAAEVGGRELDTTADDAGLIAWERSLADEHVLVVLNTHPTRPARAAIPTALPEGTAIDRLGGGRFSVQDGRAEVTLPPRTSALLVAR